MRIAIIYDCLYPNTIGGAERWYRNLAERLSSAHEVTYLTRKQWGEEGPQTPFETIAVAPGWRLYTGSGRRNITTPLRFGWGVFWHLLRHGDRYDAVHTASFPYFSVPGAWAALKLRRSPAPLFVDWHELWAKEYWLSYLGPITGRFGMAIQNLCVRLADQSFTFSRLVESRLRDLDANASIVRLTGEYAGPTTSQLDDDDAAALDRDLVIYAGRHIPEKRPEVIPPTISAVRQEIPGIRCLIFGDGPETAGLRMAVEASGLSDAIDVRGRVSSDKLDRAMGRAACLLHPSAREGYGLVVVEACVRGTPVILVEDPENAATELIEPGVNGYVAKSSDPIELSVLLVAVLRAGDSMRKSTIDWYRRRSGELSIDSSVQVIEAAYCERLDIADQVDKRGKSW